MARAHARHEPLPGDEMAAGLFVLVLLRVRDNLSVAAGHVGTFEKAEERQFLLSEDRIGNERPASPRNTWRTVCQEMTPIERDVTQQ